MNAVIQPRPAARKPQPRALSNAELSTELLRGIQLSRAQAMALTRLHFAFAGGNRRQAMEAMDRLHALDAEAERLVGRLPAPPAGDEDHVAVARHLADQKLAIAFEKLALASSISGPDMVSRAPASDEDLLILTEPADNGPAAGETEPAEPPPPFAEWPALPRVEPAEWRPALPGGLRTAIGVGLLVVFLAALAAALLVAG
jgi:hypothetical protein